MPVKTDLFATMKVKQSISKKLFIVFFLATLVPLIVLTLVNFYNGQRTLKAQSEQKTQLLASSLASRLNQLFIDSEVAIIQISKDYQVRQALTGLDQSGIELAATTPRETMAQIQERVINEPIGNRLVELLKSNPAYEYVYLLNKNGVVVIEEYDRNDPLLSSILGLSLNNRQYFQMPNQGFTFIDILVGRSSKQLGFYFSSPVYDELGKFIGVAVIKLRLDAVMSIIEQFNQQQNSVSAFFVDQDGVVIVPPTNNPDWRFKALRSLSAVEVTRVEERLLIRDPAITGGPLQFINIPALESITQASNAIIEYEDATNEGFIVGFAKAERINWTLGVQEKRSDYLAPITQLAWTSGISMLVIAAFVTVLSILLARSIARPILRLARAADDVANDKSFEPEDIQEVSSLTDELGLLARVFSSMVLALRARMAELRTINEIGYEISQSVDLTETLGGIVKKLNTVIPFDAAEITLYNKDENRMEVYVTNREVYAPDQQKPGYNLKSELFPKLFENQRGLLIEDVPAFTESKFSNARSWSTVLLPGSYLGIALREKDSVLGTIELVSKKVNGFNENNLRLLESISLQAASAVNNAQEVIAREQRLKNMEIAVDKEKAQETISAIMEQPFFQKIKERIQETRKK